MICMQCALRWRSNQTRWFDVLQLNRILWVMLFHKAASFRGHLTMLQWWTHRSRGFTNFISRPQSGNFCRRFKLSFVVCPLWPSTRGLITFFFQRCNITNRKVSHSSNLQGYPNHWHLDGVNRKACQQSVTAACSLCSMCPHICCPQQVLCQDK